MIELRLADNLKSYIKKVEACKAVISCSFEWEKNYKTQ